MTDTEFEPAERGNHTVAGLKRKRAEIAGIVADHERKLKHWREMLVHVDAVLRLMDGGIDPASIRPLRVQRRTKYLPGAELARHAMDEMRRAGRPLAVRELVDSAIAQPDVPDTLQARLSLKDRLGRWLKDKAEAGEMVRVGPAHNPTWALPDMPGLDSPEEG